MSVINLLTLFVAGKPKCGFPRYHTRQSYSKAKFKVKNRWQRTATTWWKWRPKWKNQQTVCWPSFCWVNVKFIALSQREQILEQKCFLSRTNRKHREISNFGKYSKQTIILIFTLGLTNVGFCRWADREINKLWFQCWPSLLLSIAPILPQF